MNTLFNQIFDLLTQPPGNLIYHLILVFSILTGFQTVFFIHSEQNRTLARRLITALGILLAGQILLFLISALVWQKLINNPAFLLPFDRGITLLSLIVIGWIWNYPQSDKKADVVFLLLALFSFIILFVDLAIQFNPLILIPFHFIWQIANLVIISLSLVLLISRKPQNWETGFSFFLIVLAGSLTSLFTMQSEEELSAALRLAQICAFPLLPSLVKILLPVSPVPTKQNEAKVESVPSRSFKPQESRVILPWLRMAATEKSSEVLQLLITATGKTFSSDLTFLVKQENPYRPIILETGYDLLRDEALPPLQIEAENCPLISAALQKGKNLKLIADGENSAQDLLVLTKAVGLTVPGHVLMSPISYPANEKRAILLFSPYSRHEWSIEDQTLLNNISEEMVGLFSQLDRREEMDKTIQNLKEQLSLSEREIQALQQKIHDLSELAIEPQNPVPATPENPLEVAGLLAIQREAQATIQRLENENRTLRDALRDLRGKTAQQSEVEHLEKELRQALEEIARLQNALANANMKIIELQSASGQTTNLGIKDNEAILSIIQELRQPVSSVIGYSDLLINESIGNLNNQQHKFLERIKSSADRMQALLDDLLQTSVFTISPIELAPQPLDVETILDQAITDMADLLREKEINLLIEIPPDLPTFYADRDALHQVLIHLLQNAGSATPPEGNINLKVKVEQGEKNTLFVLFQITDEGGGIPAEELSRVFSHQVKNGSTHIKGLGDAGVGLSIAKTLIEAHGGRIWVESDGKKNSTFSILLPVKTPAFTSQSLVS